MGVWLGVRDGECGDQLDLGFGGIHRNGIWDEWGLVGCQRSEIEWIWGLGGSIGMGFRTSGVRFRCWERFGGSPWFFGLLRRL